MVTKMANSNSGNGGSSINTSSYDLPHAVKEKERKEAWSEMEVRATSWKYHLTMFALLCFHISVSIVR